MERKKENKLPQFQSLKEEREYWEAHGPLAEGHKGRINKPKSDQKRSSFLSIRFTGEELTKLRDMAAKFGMGPSTYARQLLRLTIEQAHLDNQALFRRPSYLFPSLYHFNTANEVDLQWLPDKTHDKLAKKAYSAYIESTQELQKTYDEIRKKAHDACDKVREGDPSALQAMLRAIFECLWVTLVYRQSTEIEEIPHFLQNDFKATPMVHPRKE